MKKILGVVAMLVLTAGAAVAQVNFGSIRGTVTDSTGAVVKGADVVAVDQANGSVHTTKTNGTGEYELTNLSADPFKVTVTFAGFNTSSTTLTLSVGAASLVNVKLTNGTKETVIEVASDSFGGVNLETQEVSQVVTEEQIDQLPSLNRNPYDFAQLSGFASSDSSAASRGVGYNFSGARSASTDILLDGAENTDVYGVAVGQTVPLDGVQEFSVIAADFPAQYGRASGGVVNTITKQGTNTFHGSAWEFNRVADLASNSYNNNAVGQPKSGFTRNQFGYSVGGPIIKNKLFFFSTTEWIRVRSTALNSATVVLPAFVSSAATATQNFFAGKPLAFPVNGPQYTLDYAGDTTYISEVGCLPTSSTSGVTQYGTPCSQNAANQRTVFANAHPGINLYTQNDFGVVYYQSPGDSGAGTPQNTYNTLGNIQYVFTDRTTLTGRYSLYSEKDQSGSVATSPYLGYNTGATSFDNNFLGTLNHTFTNNISNSFKVLYSRLNNQQPLGTQPVGPTLYANSSTIPNLGNSSLQFPGYLPTSPGSALPFGGPQNFGQFLDDTTWVKGKHVITFGGQFLYIKDNRTFGAYENAIEALAPGGSSTNGTINNFLTGQIGQFEVAINPQGELPCSVNSATGNVVSTAACTLQFPLQNASFSRSNRYKDYAVYAQDSWKATPRLTLNYGLRWEVYGPQHAQSHDANIDSNFLPGAGSNLIDRIAHGQIFTRANSPVGGLWKNNYTQFGPRIGFAYDLTGDGKTSLRGGFGISYERNFNNVTYNVIQNPPGTGVVNDQSVRGGAQFPLSTNNLGPLAATTGTATFNPPNLRAVDPHIRPAYTESYNISLGREIKPGTTLEATFTGERGIRNYSIVGVNQNYYGQIYEGYSAPNGLAPVPKPVRANLQYGNINFRGADGDSYFDGLDLALNSRNIYHSGLTLTAHYTWSHSIDNTSSTFTDGGSNNDNLGYLDPLNHRLDRGASDFDIRHRIIVAPVYEVPYFKETSGLKKLLLDGFSVSTIFTATTGNPFTEFDSSDEYVAKAPRASFNTPVSYKRTGTAADISSVYGPNTFGYLKVPDFTPTNYAEGTNPICGNCSDFGPFPSNMSARNAFSGPGQWNVDADAAKQFAINQRYGLQIRGEAYNIANHANMYLNNGGYNDVSYFNYALGYKNGRRRVQLAARFTF